MTQPIEQKIKSLARSDVMQTLSMHRHELKRLGVKSLRLFGSVARDEARPDSDIDFLVEFLNDPSFFELFEVKSQNMRNTLSQQQSNLAIRPLELGNESIKY